MTEVDNQNKALCKNQQLRHDLSHVNEENVNSKWVK